MNKIIFKRAFSDSLPVMAGYIFLGIGFGILLADKGYGAPWAALMSASVYAGSMQYVAVDLIGRCASLVNTAVMTLMINARHFFYGLTMLEKYSDMGKAKPYLIFSLTDETFSLVCRDTDMHGADYKSYCVYLSVMDQLYWITGSVLGGVIGTALPFDSTGIDFVMTSLFVVIFLEQWLSSKNHFSALTGVGVSVICLLLFGPDRFIIPSMLGIVLVLSLCKMQALKGGDGDER